LLPQSHSLKNKLQRTLTRQKTPDFYLQLLTCWRSNFSHPTLTSQQQTSLGRARIKQHPAIHGKTLRAVSQTILGVLVLPHKPVQRLFTDPPISVLLADNTQQTIFGISHPDLLEIRVLQQTETTCSLCVRLHVLGSHAWSSEPPGEVLSTSLTDRGSDVEGAW